VRLPDLKLETRSELARGAPLNICDRYLIPIYRIDTATVKEPSQAIWLWAEPKGLVIMEKARSRYIPLDGEEMRISSLTRKVQGMRSLVDKLRRDLKLSASKP